MFQCTVNFKNFKIYLHFVCLPPAIRPGCTRCGAPKISHNKGNGGGFTKMLFRRRFTNCAMVIPFILHFLPWSSTFLKQGVNLTEGDDSLLRLLLTTLRHTQIWLARDTISFSGTMFSRVLYYIMNFEIIALDK